MGDDYFNFMSNSEEEESKGLADYNKQTVAGEEDKDDCCDRNEDDTDQEGHESFTLSERYRTLNVANQGRILTKELKNTAAEASRVGEYDHESASFS